MDLSYDGASYLFMGALAVGWLAATAFCATKTVGDLRARRFVTGSWGALCTIVALISAVMAFVDAITVISNTLPSSMLSGTNGGGCGQSSSDDMTAACAPEPPGFKPNPPTEPDRHRLTSHLTTYPVGARIPQTFIDQGKASDMGGHAPCFNVWDQKSHCDVYVLDFYGDGALDVLLTGPEDQNDHYLAGEIFRRNQSGAWAKSGELVVTCAASIQALRRGELKFAPAKVRDIVVGGRQFSLLPETDYGCPELGGKEPTPPN